MKTVRLTLHNGEDVLINWESVAFATPSVSEQTRETFTKLVFTGNSSHEVDVRENLDEVNSILLNVCSENGETATTTSQPTKVTLKKKK